MCDGLGTCKLGTELRVVVDLEEVAWSNVDVLDRMALLHTRHGRALNFDGLAYLLDVRDLDANLRQPRMVQAFGGSVQQFPPALHNLAGNSLGLANSDAFLSRADEGALGVNANLPYLNTACLILEAALSYLLVAYNLRQGDSFDLCLGRRGNGDKERKDEECCLHGTAA